MIFPKRIATLVFECHVPTHEEAMTLARRDYFNSNGLINGRVPAGHACPFFAECKMANESCPTKTSLKEEDYACATARMHSLLTISDSDILRKFCKKDSATHPKGDKKEKVQS
jgi:hypothetical protein